MRLTSYFTLSLLTTLAAVMHVQGAPEPRAPQAEIITILVKVGRTPTFAPRCPHSPPLGFDAMVREAAATYGVDPRVLATTVYRESGCREDALGAVGEVGLSQIYPKVWLEALQSEGLVTTADDLWDPATNLLAGAYVLAQAQEAAGGDLAGTFRRYNGSGPKARRYAREQVEKFSDLWGQ